MRFNVQLLSYEANDSWVDQAIIDLKACLHQTECPSHAQSGYGPKGDKQCENAQLFESMKEHGLF